MTSGTAKALGAKPYEFNQLNPMIWHKIGKWSIMPFPVNHDAIEPVGFVIIDRSGDRLMFATDTFLIKYIFPGINIIAVECNHIHEEIVSGGDAIRKRLYGTHMSLETCIKYLEKVNMDKTREIHLIHISDTRGDPKRFKNTIQAITGIPVYTA